MLQADGVEIVGLRNTIVNFEVVVILSKAKTKNKVTHT
jgi:putative flippase GtrA